jgi:flagellar hook-basal body complex protein FliE
MNTINPLLKTPVGIEPIEMPGAGGGIQPGEKAGEGFMAHLNRSINDVNELLSVADKKGAEIAVGKSENLHDAMINFEKAESAFKLLVQVRNRALDAYHEIMRMQV